MSRKANVQRVLNVVLIISLLAMSSAFLGYSSGYGLFLAPIAWAIAVGVFKHIRWGYFAAAVWGLGCYQLAKEGLDFEPVKRSVMVLSIPLVVLSIYLHETLGRKTAPQQRKES